MTERKNDNSREDRFGIVILVAIGIVAVLLSFSAVSSLLPDDLSIFFRAPEAAGETSATGAEVTDTSPEEAGVSVECASASDADGTDVAPVQNVNEVPAVEPEKTDCVCDGAGDSGIVDFGDSGVKMDKFIQNLLYKSRDSNIRIAFLGDSFIEGDILTSSFRNELQEEFGGSGVGFVPFADPIAKYRGTVHQEYSGWTCYNLLKKKEVPDRYQNDFFISGYVSVPDEGASAVFRSGFYKGRALTSSKAEIIFKNRGEGVMEVVVNQCDTLHFNLPASDDVQFLDVTHQSIEELVVSLPVCEDFVGYGVVFEGECGVNVDNYALRSHQGPNLTSTSQKVNSQIGMCLEYDLIVMEYGLNAMEKTVTQYGPYSARMRKAVEHIKNSFPGSAILILSIGDVGMKVDGKIITPPGVPAMVAGQRLVASRCGVSFWNMFQEMGGYGSMKIFVDNGWANKDYLHINFKGGEQIGRFLRSSIADREKDVNGRLENHSNPQDDV